MWIYCIYSLKSRVTKCWWKKKSNSGKINTRNQNYKATAYCNYLAWSDWCSVLSAYIDYFYCDSLVAKEFGSICLLAPRCLYLPLISYTAPCNGVVSHGAQFSVFGLLPTARSRSQRVMQHFTSACCTLRPQYMQVTYASDEPWLFWLQEKPKDPQFEPPC